MVGNPIVVKIINSTIDKAIRDLKSNPKKGLESLVVLANRFANNNFQKDLVENLQAILSNPNDAYYNLIPSLINHVSPHTIKTFLINMAYNSWSYGGKKIKQYKRLYNYAIPWTIIFDFTTGASNPLDNDTIIRIIEQGKKIGVYTYMFFTDCIDNFSDILRPNPDCAFILFVPPTILTADNISMITPYHNTLFSVLYEPAVNMRAFTNATNLLYDNQCLFGSHLYYSNENTEYILSNEWINQIATVQSPFRILIESQNCTQENAALIHDYINRSKVNREHPIFLIDLYEDITKIDKQLSDRPRPFKIQSNTDMGNMTLQEILSK